MSFAVCHVEKCNPNTYALGLHISREHIPTNADQDKTHENVYLVSHGNNLNEAIDNRIKEGYKGKTAIRKDAVKALSIVLTGTYDQMFKLESQGRLDQWVKANQNWLDNRFGKANVVSLALHMDEKTPHLHVVVVPLTADGRLSAKEILGDRNKMKQMQTDYAKQMERFGLERGKEGSRAKHEDVKEYYNRVNYELPKLREEVKEIKGEIEEVGTLKKAQMTFKASMDKLSGKSEISALKSKIETLENTNETLTAELKKAEKHIDKAEAWIELAQNRIKKLEADVAGIDTTVRNAERPLLHQIDTLKKEKQELVNKSLDSKKNIVKTISNDLIEQGSSVVYIVKDNELRRMAREDYLKLQVIEKQKQQQQEQQEEQQKRRGMSR